MVYATNLENGPGPKPDRPRHSHERASIKCNSNRVVKSSFYESSMTQYIVCRSCGYRGEISRPVRIAVAAKNPLSRAGNRAGGPGALPNDSYPCPCVYRIAFRRSFVPGVWECRFVDRHRHDNGRSRVAVGKSGKPDRAANRLGKPAPTGRTRCEFHRCPNQSLPILLRNMYSRFVIFSQARSGSTMLTLSLNSHQHVVCHGEVLSRVGVERLVSPEKLIYTLKGKLRKLFGASLLRERDADPMKFLGEHVWLIEAKHVGFKVILEDILQSRIPGSSLSILNSLRASEMDS